MKYKNLKLNISKEMVLDGETGTITVERGYWKRGFVMTVQLLLGSGMCEGSMLKQDNFSSKGFPQMMKPVPATDMGYFR